MAKRFLVLETLVDSWNLYLTDETGKPSQCVAEVFDKDTLDLLVKAPAMEQMLRVIRQRGNEPSLTIAEHKPKRSLYGVVQEIYGRYIKGNSKGENS